MLDFILGVALGRSTAPKAVPASLQPLPHSEFDSMKSRLDAMELACAGLWKLLKERGLKEEDLVAAMAEVDALDGRIDGRIKPKAGDCPHCGKRLLTRNGAKCLWCAEALPASALGA